ncbi:ABC transporter ATP-binding protein [Thalassomonas viridans]|uniref:ABC transporter ATP-binding protein n=1 Tax=Thalassomonas viridans TaxID=137584 RepID=A0AAE9Z6Y7_9GAMM|nr:ABC transporter ATP-binding protein [Thalassomonas viridans]WDE07901.1 ABC transporter ATP-binding protein [Thalassomonas viridans]
MTLIYQFIRSLCALYPKKVAANLSLQFVLGLTQGIGILHLLPLLSLVSGQSLQVLGAASLNGSEQGLPDLPALLSYLPQLTLTQLLVIFVLILCCHGLVKRKQFCLSAAIENAFVYHSRKSLYQALCRTNWPLLCRLRSTNINHVLTIEVQRLAHMVKLFFELTSVCLLSLFYIALGLWLQPQLLMFCLATGLVLFLLLRKYNHQANDLGLQSQQHIRSVFALAGNFLGGVKTIKAHALEPVLQDKFSRQINSTREVDDQFARSHSLAAFYYEIGASILLCLLLYLAIGVMNTGLAVLITLLFTFSRLMPKLVAGFKLYQQLLNHLPAYQAVKQLKEQLSREREAQGVKSTEASLSFNKALSFTDVCFAYPEKAVIQGVSLKIQAKEITALVGPSGSGKSTLLDLMVGIISPTQGNIFIDGRPLTPGVKKNWQGKIAYLTQEAFLFHDTVRANMQLISGRVSDENIWQVLEQVSAKTFVAALPQGLDTRIGDRGMTLSGGERQRLALARALLAKPELLILDEATNALDKEHERTIDRLIAELKGQITVVIVVHDLVRVRQADHLYVIEDGRVKERGSRAELLVAGQGYLTRLAGSSELV